MLGRKRECLDPRQGQAPKKKRWQEDDSDSADAEVTANELQEWRRRDALEAELLEEATKEELNDPGSSTATKTETRFAWMESEEENGENAKAHVAVPDAAVPALEPDILHPATASTAPAPPLGVAPVPSLASTPGILPPPPPPSGGGLGVLPCSATVPTQEEWFHGRIKRYSDLPGGGGYGFVDCEETKIRFARDVYIHKNQMNGLTIGAEVTFTITRNSRGEPQARNVMRPEEAQALRVAAQQQAAVARVAAPPAASLMSEEQAKQFQASLRRRVEPID